MDYTTSGLYMLNKNLQKLGFDYLVFGFLITLLIFQSRTFYSSKWRNLCCVTKETEWRRGKIKKIKKGLAESLRFCAGILLGMAYVITTGQVM